VTRRRQLLRLQRLVKPVKCQQQNGAEEDSEGQRKDIVGEKGGGRKAGAPAHMHKWTLVQIFCEVHDELGKKSGHKRGLRQVK